MPLLLFQLLSLLFSLLSVYAQTTAVLIGQNDSSVQYSAGWRTAMHQGQPFRLVDFLEADVHISLPNGTVSFQYMGFKRRLGASYGVCLDCRFGKNGSTFTVDAHDPAENGTQPSVDLFTLVDLDPTIVHSIIVWNFPDERFQNIGQLTFDRAVVSVEDVAIWQNMMGNPGLNPSASDSTISTVAVGSGPTFTATKSQLASSITATIPIPTSSSLVAESKPHTIISTTHISISTTPPTRTPEPGSTSSSHSAAAGLVPTPTSRGSAGEDPSTSVGSSIASVTTISTGSTPSASSSAGVLTSGNASRSPTSSTALSQQTAVSAPPSSKSRIPASVIAVVIVLSIVAALSCAVGVFVLLKIRRRRFNQKIGDTEGPPVLPEMSLTTINFPSFGTQRTYASGSTDTLEPDDSASFGPYRRERPTYINVRSVSPGAQSISMENLEDMEYYRSANPFLLDGRSISTGDVSDILLHPPAIQNPFADELPQQQRLRELGSQAWILRTPQGSPKALD